MSFGMDKLIFNCDPFSQTDREISGLHRTQKENNEVRQEKQQQ